MTAAETIWPRSRRRSTLEDVPEEVVEHAKLHVARHARLRARRARDRASRGEGRTAMGELGGETQATVIGLDARPAGAERGVRERDALPRARLRRHALRLGRARLHRHRARARSPSAKLGGAAGERRAARRSSPATRSSPGSAWPRPGRFHARGFHPTAICGIFGATAAAARLTGGDAARRLRARSASPARWRPGLFAYLDDGTATKPIHPAWAAHGAHPRHAARLARRRRPAVGARGQVRPLPRLPRRGAGRDRHRRAARRPRRALGDAAHRVQAVPGLPLHARLARRGGRRAGRPDALRRTRSRRSSSPSRRPASRSCSSRRTRRRRRARTTRASSRSSTRSRPCSCAARRPWATSRTRRSPTRPSWPWREGPVRNAGVPDLPAGVPGRRARHAGRRPDARSATSRTRRAAPRTRCRPTRSARSSAATRRSRSTSGRGRARARRSSTLEEQDDLAAALAPLTAAKEPVAA